MPNGNPDDIIGRFFKPETTAFSAPDTEGRRSVDIVEIQPTILPGPSKKEQMAQRLKAQRQRRRREANVMKKVTEGSLGYGYGIPTQEAGQLPSANEDAKKIISFLGASDVDMQGNPLSYIDTNRIQQNIESLKGRDLKAFNRALNRYQKERLKNIGE